MKYYSNCGDNNINENDMNIMKIIWIWFTFIILFTIFTYHKVSNLLLLYYHFC